jgi:hypothetical protein
MKDWSEYRFEEMEQMVDNTRTWVYRSKDEFESRAADYIAARLLDKLTEDFFNKGDRR